MNKRRVGSEKEARAAKYLEEAGMQILARNFRCRQGEIDLVAADGDVVVFVEVKYRKNAGWGLPEEAVTARKMQRISRTAEFFYARYQLPPDTPCRFDVIAIEGDTLRYYRDAFSFMG
ncbi:MAG: YraN family protein [Solobacterium sp.]|nr:YraN family protein [Eubacterium sp.]MBQ9152799.1 YraN family protein [Solobacterium sp.]MBQ9321706.1 YraN family protein [Eubacterium sp.]